MTQGALRRSKRPEPSPPSKKSTCRQSEGRNLLDTPIATLAEEKEKGGPIPNKDASFPVQLSRAVTETRKTKTELIAWRKGVSALLRKVRLG